MNSSSNAEGNGDRPGGSDATAARRRRTPWPLAVVAVLFVVVPFLTWYWTWFGRSLDDEEIGKYLSEGKPRHAQHALSQVAEAFERGDAGAGRWNAQVLGLASSPSPDVRMTAAWVMGAEHRSGEFRETLARLLEDPEPIVRRNAALALVRFGDGRCRPELLAMLRPYTLRAADSGTALTALTAGSRVKRDSLLLRFKTAAGESGELRSPLPGTVGRASLKDGDVFEAGAELFVLAPDAEQVTDALTGLLYLGQEEELADVERYARGVEGMPQDLKTKAALTAEAIKRRVSQNQ
jgi:HEAT repeat protein